MASALHIDLESFPLIVLTLRGPQGAAEAKDYCDAIDSILGREQPYAVLHRIEAFGSSLSAAGIIAKWSLGRTAQLLAQCVGGAIVVQSEAFRFLLSSFQLVTKLPAPVELVKTEPEALAWIAERFAERGVRFNPAAFAASGR